MRSGPVRGGRARSSGADVAHLSADSFARTAAPEESASFNGAEHGVEALGRRDADPSGTTNAIAAGSAKPPERGPHQGDTMPGSSVAWTQTRGAQSGRRLPSFVYASGGTPCVAAHSTTRALYGAYSGPPYQVRRSSDNTTRDIGVLSAGGYANAAAQDSFCANTNCVITIVYDQSGRNNRLTQAPPGYWPGPAAGGWDNLADAKAAPITIGRTEGVRRLHRTRHRLP